MQGIAHPLERHKDHLWSLVTVSFDIQADFLSFSCLSQCWPLLSVATGKVDQEEARRGPL